MKKVLEKRGIDYSLGEESDLPELFLFFQQIPKETESSKLLKVDFSKALSVLRSSLTSPDAACLMATLPESGIIVGAILLIKSTVWWSSTEYFTNVAFGVLPGYRKGFGIQDELLEASKNFSESLKLPLLVDIFDATGKNFLKAKWFQRKGFKNIGFKVAYVPKE